MKREGDCSSSSCVKNVTVSDALSGQIVFQRVYAWKTASAFSNLGSLIKVFYQFAREVDDGVISKIDFQAQRNTLRRKRDDVLKCKRGDTMQMVTVKTEDVIVSVFFDLDGLLQPSIRLKNCFQILLHALQLAFESNFLLAFSFLEVMIVIAEHVSGFKDITEHKLFSGAGRQRFLPSVATNLESLSNPEVYPDLLEQYDHPLNIPAVKHRKGLHMISKAGFKENEKVRGKVEYRYCTDHAGDVYEHVDQVNFHVDRANALINKLFK
eukprot:gene2551-2792_t